MLKRSFAAALALLASAAFAQLANVQPNASASFDCAKARGRVEKAICGESTLAALDHRVADLYALAIAQAVDPGGAKRDQRRWLGARDDCKDVACIEQIYRRRLTELTTLTGRFTAAEAGQLCATFVDAASRATALATMTAVDDGALHRATFDVDNRTFAYYASDAGLEQPAYISYVMPTNREVRICDFDTVVGSAVTDGSDDVCTAVETMDSAIEPVELGAVADASAYTTGRRGTLARAVGKSDIDNDGFEESLIEYAYSSDAGLGCKTNYFELLAEDGRSLATNSNAVAVRELQSLGSDGPNARDCGLATNRLFRFADKIYLESNAGNAPGPPHEVRILRGDAVVKVCAFERQIRTKVKTLY